MCSLGEAANAATAKLLKNIEMKWSRIDLSKSTHQLLTSDRPIDMPLGLADPEAYISLPFLRASCSCCLAPCLAFDRRKPADLVALEQSMQRRSRQMRDGRLEGIKAIVERQQRMLAERNSESFLLGAEYR